MKNQKSKIKNQKFNSKVKITFGFLLAAFAFCLLSFDLASAQAPLSTRSITISPPSVELNLNPGEKTEGVLKVINRSDAPITFTAKVRDYVVNDNLGTPVVLPDENLSSNKFSAAAWLTVTPDTFTVEPRGKQELNYYLEAPLSGAAGGHYAAVVYEPVETLSVKGTGTGVNTQVATLFYINLKGEIIEAAEVKNFYAKSFNEYGPVEITSEILNNGDLHIKPEAEITIKNLFGQTVAREMLEKHNIFPEKSRLYTNSLGQKWMIGPYTAILTGTYGTSNSLNFQAAVSFFIFPWKVAIIGLFVAIIIILLALTLRRKKTQRFEQKTELPSSPTNHQKL